MTPETVSERATDAAASKSALPACEAVTVHEPTAIRLKRFSLTAQAPDALNATGRPDDATAVSAIGGSPSRKLGSAPKSIVCAARATAKPCVTSGAGR